ncbi:MAG: hypothetical protein WCT31_02095 [Candidatus Micrarchaeia archaeon]
MNEDILIPALLVSAGAILAVIIYTVLFKFSNKILRMFQLYPESQDIMKLSLRVVSSFISIVVFLIFLRKALFVIGLDFTGEFIESVIVNSGKYLSAFLIIIGGFYLSGIVNKKIYISDSRFKPYSYFLSSLLINTAFILTGLAMAGIDISVFLEVYKIILLTIGVTVALVIGIPLGIYISNKINRQGKTKGKHRLFF